MKSITLSLCLLACLLVVTGPPARATLYTITSSNATATVDTTQPNGPGMNSWTIDGLDILEQQWFFFRTDATSVARNLNSLNLLSATQNGAGSTLNLLYGDGATLGSSTYTINVAYALTDPNPGTRSSDLGETITINNLSTTNALTMHFFQYSDFDLSGPDPAPQKSQVTVTTNKPTAGAGSFQAEQISGPISIIESGDANTTGNPVPNRSEVTTEPGTLNSLTTVGGYNLNHLTPNGLNQYTAPANAGDVTWAFQWDKTIASKGSFTISKDKQASYVVPEPTALLLLGGCLLFVGRKLAANS